jgi:hypothetical protein
VAGPGIAVGTPFTFSAGYTGGSSSAGPIPPIAPVPRAPRLAARA